MLCSRRGRRQARRAMTYAGMWTPGAAGGAGGGRNCSDRANTDVQSRAHSIYSAYDGVVPARGKALLKTDVAIAVPAGTYGRVGEWSAVATRLGRCKQFWAVTSAVTGKQDVNCVAYWTQ
jgi:hypothetical protein